MCFDHIKYLGQQVCVVKIEIRVGENHLVISRKELQMLV